jgi:hypothetical protein
VRPLFQVRPRIRPPERKSAPIDSGSLYKIAHIYLSIDLRFIVQNDT